MLGPDGVRLDALDLLLVRGLPRGSLEQVIFRMDALHLLAEQHGVRCVNGPRALERTIDKSWAGALLAAAGVPTPPTIVCERRESALAAFERLGGDVVVKPLFGAMGNGIVRVHDRDVAHRVFAALELERAVYYLQRTVDGPGRRDLRVLVIAGEVAGAMERVVGLVARQRRPRRRRPRAVTLTDLERYDGAGGRRGGRGRHRRRRPARRRRRRDRGARGQRDPRLAGAAVGLRGRPHRRVVRACERCRAMRTLVSGDAAMRRSPGVHRGCCGCPGFAALAHAWRCRGG